MTRALTPDQVDAYRQDGILFPIRVLPEDAMPPLLAQLEALELRDGGQLSRRSNQKPHLYLGWMNRLIRHPKILDAVEDILGPDILCWGAGFFIKNPGPAFVSWHQDSTYWGLSSPDVVTAWLAFTPSTVEAGCMQVVPGTHQVQAAHRDTFAAANLLSRGQEIAVAVDRTKAIDVVLRPGEISLHHVMLVHGSEPNRSRHRRIGLAIRYIPTSIRQTVGDHDSATLVRGSDRYGHFRHEPVPAADFDPQALAYHAAACAEAEQILYRGAATGPEERQR